MEEAKEEHVQDSCATVTNCCTQEGTIPSTFFPCFADGNKNSLGCVSLCAITYYGYIELT